MENSAQDITSKIWSMANELRGTMTASDFQVYILGFMFYRYLSEREEQFIEQSNVKIDELDENTLTDALDWVQSNYGYQIEPKYLWRHILESIHDNQAPASIWADVKFAFKQHANDELKNVFDDMNLENSRLGHDVDTRVISLNKLAQLIDAFDYDVDDRDLLGDVYEYLISKFAANAGASAGEFYTPHAVSKLLARIVTANAKNKDSFSAYDPTMGSGSLLLTVRDQFKVGSKAWENTNLSGQELTTTTYNLARMNLWMHGLERDKMDLHNADTLASDWPKGTVNGKNSPEFFDAVVANPPYSAHWDNNPDKLKDVRFKDYGKLAPKTKADYAFLLHGLYHLNEKGTMAIVLPHGVLFRGAAEKTIRENLLKQGNIRAVIGLPANIFYNTSIPTVVLVLKKDTTNRDVLFIDASKGFEKAKKQNILTDEYIDKIMEAYTSRQDIEKYSRMVAYDEIVENDFNLNIPRYVDTFEEEEPIDLVAVSQEIGDINRDIEQNEADLLAMISDLAVTDDSQPIIESAKQLLGGKHE